MTCYAAESKSITNAKNEAVRALPKCPWIKWKQQLLNVGKGVHISCVNWVFVIFCPLHLLYLYILTGAITTKKKKKKRPTKNKNKNFFFPRKKRVIQSNIKELRRPPQHLAHCTSEQGKNTKIEFHTKYIDFLDH